MKAIMEIIARTYKINEEYLNKLEMPLRLVFWMGATWAPSILCLCFFFSCFSFAPFVELVYWKNRRFALETFDVHINCGSIKRKRKNEVTQTLNSTILLRPLQIFQRIGICSLAMAMDIDAIDVVWLLLFTNFAYSRMQQTFLNYFNASAFWCYTQKCVHVLCVLCHVRFFIMMLRK